MAQKAQNYKYYDLIIALFVAVLLISNISAVKLIDIGPIITDGGAILFPLAYIFGDILTEVYGYKYTRRAIWTGFFAMAVAGFSFLVVGMLPPNESWGNQEAYEAILGFVPRIFFASLVAYLFGEFINAYVLAKLKIKMGKEHLWVRLIGSTVAGQTIDTVVFGLIAFGGILGITEMLNFVVVGIGFKISVEVLMLPITYRAINFLKKAEKADAYDKTTDFSPLNL
ncbi:VUT family protein [Candidatus Saccharibacteria bacterium CPR2]|nr:VUT family protein [Candidatus Saccharibacteria bacterium CPR2]